MFGIYIQDEQKTNFCQILFAEKNTISFTRKAKEPLTVLKSLKVDYDMSQTGPITLEVLIDTISVEAFFFDGMYSMTNLVLPLSKQTGIKIFISDEHKQHVVVGNIRIYELNQTYKPKTNHYQE